MAYGIRIFENGKKNNDVFLQVKDKFFGDLLKHNYTTEKGTVYNVSDLDDEALYVDLLTRDPNNIMTVTGDRAFTSPISGFIDMNSSFGASAQYSAEATTADSKTNSLFANTAQFAAQRNVGRDVKVANSRLSRVVWNSSSFDSINVNFFIVAAHPEDDPLKEGIKIFDYTLPSKSGIGLGSSFYVAPGGYGRNLVGGQMGTISLMIGSWFRAMNAFVVTNANLEVSKQKTMNGKTPLYVKISMTLSPSREFTAKEVKSWFIGTDHPTFTDVDVGGGSFSDTLGTLITSFISKLF